MKMRNDKFHLIAAMPRSGSTLLLRQFNSCPDTLLMGESGTALNKLLAFWKLGVGSKHFKHVKGDWDEAVERGVFPAWFNTHDDEEVKACVKELAWTWLNRQGAAHWGCKQILFGAQGCPLEEFDLLHQLFPGLQVTILTRNLHDVQASWKKKFPSNPPAYLGPQKARLLDCARPFITQLDYTQLTDQTFMEQFLSGQGLEVNRDKLAQVIAKKIK